MLSYRASILRVWDISDVSSSPKSTDSFVVRSMSLWTAVGNDSRKGNLKLFLNSCPWFYQKQYSSVSSRELMQAWMKVEIEEEDF